MKVAIYILASLLTLVGGLALLFAKPTEAVWLSISTSLIASGLASLAFSVIKYFDDKDSNVQQIQMSKSLRELNSKINEIVVGKVIVDEPNNRCVFKRQLTDEFANLLNMYKDSEKIKIDIIGFSLYRFYKEQLENILEKSHSQIRIIVQDPRNAASKIMAEQESRDLNNVKKDVYDMTKRIIELAKKYQPRRKETYARFVKEDKSSVEARWFQGCASVTIVRFNDVIYVRSRFLGEGKDAPVFFERYHINQKQCFEAYEEYFQNAWEKSFCPKLEECSELE